MRVLLIKTSSMGDIIHTLPALTDAGHVIPGITFDWVVEDSFAEIPGWHPLVKSVIPVSLRRWRKGIFAKDTRVEWNALRDQLRDHQYDIILDAQGLVKSAILTFLARGERVGLDWKSARESSASLAYERKCHVNFYQHAIVRMRSLFSQALKYPLPQTEPTFALNRQILQQPTASKYIVFLHGTTWVTKQWPETYWVQLATLASQEGYRIKICGGNDDEIARAKHIADQNAAMDMVGRVSITEMAKLLVNAEAAVAVDTGFGHLAAALDVPTVSIYGPTNPEFTGALGKHSLQLAAHFSCAPCLSRTCTYKQPSTVVPACYTTVTPEQVWSAVRGVLPSMAG